MMQLPMLNTTVKPASQHLLRQEPALVKFGKENPEDKFSQAQLDELKGLIDEQAEKGAMERSWVALTTYLGLTFASNWYVKRQQSNPEKSHADHEKHDEKDLAAPVTNSQPNPKESHAPHEGHDEKDHNAHGPFSTPVSFQNDSKNPNKPRYQDSDEVELTKSTGDPHGLHDDITVGNLVGLMPTEGALEATLIIIVAIATKGYFSAKKRFFRKK